MTNYEFENEYQKLAEAYPEIYGKKFRKELIAKSVYDLDKGWFASLVKRLILNPYLKIDFDEAARNERLNKNKVRRTQDIFKAQEVIKNNSSDEGLKNFLKNMRVNSLEEAIKKTKKELA